MALPKQELKKKLTEFGVPEENLADAVKWILDGHTDSTDALKNRIEELENSVASLDSVTKERDQLKVALEKAGDAAKVQAEFDAFKKQVETEKANTGKTEAVRKLLKGSGVERDTFLDLLMGRVDLDKVTLDENGAVKDADSFIKGMKEDYADCFGKVETANPGASNPLSGGKNGAGKKTREEIMKIEDYGERMKAISENLEAFGYAPR